LNIVTVTLLCLVIAQLAYSQEATQREKATVGHDEIIWQLRAGYAAFNRGDFDAAVAALDPKIEWTEPTEFPGGGTCHGHEAVKKYLMRSGAGWADGSSESERFITAGDRISAFARQD
jgi:ketosteroid isomerase-like protein